MPPYQILVSSSVVGPWWSLLPNIRCLWRHIHVCKRTFWRSFLTQHAYRDAGAAVRQGEQQKSWGQWKFFKNKKIVAKYVCFCSSTMLTSKIITEIIENYSELSGGPNGCTYLFQVDLDKPLKLPMILLCKGTSALLAPLLKGPRRKCTRHASILRRPCAYYSTRTLFTRCRLQCVTVISINYQRSPEREQFTTAKISGNTL